VDKLWITSLLFRYRVGVDRLAIVCIGLLFRYLSVIEISLFVPIAGGVGMIG
jgi:hypothetical protein